MVVTVSTPFDLSQAVVGFLRDGTAHLIQNAPGPPARVNGFTVGAPVKIRNAPHGGEMHPDGDEVLFLLSGDVSVVLEEGGSERVLALHPGQAVVVPRGVWHRVVLKERSQILHITPGPGGEHRPLPPHGAA
jgi:mannose-6-phosphate isomerase-like protein (cupin superfamily)